MTTGLRQPQLTARVALAEPAVERAAAPPQTLVDSRQRRHGEHAGAQAAADGRRRGAEQLRHVLDEQDFWRIRVRTSRHQQIGHCEPPWDTDVKHAHEISAWTMRPPGTGGTVQVDGVDLTASFLRRPPGELVREAVLRPVSFNSADPLHNARHTRADRCDRSRSRQPSSTPNESSRGPRGATGRALEEHLPNKTGTHRPAGRTVSTTHVPSLAGRRTSPGGPMRGEEARSGRLAARSTSGV